MIKDEQNVSEESLTDAKQTKKTWLVKLLDPLERHIPPDYKIFDFFNSCYLTEGSAFLPGLIFQCVSQNLRRFFYAPHFLD